MGDLSGVSTVELHVRQSDYRFLRDIHAKLMKKNYPRINNDSQEDDVILDNCLIKRYFYVAKKDYPADASRAEYISVVHNIAADADRLSVEVEHTLSARRERNSFLRMFAREVDSLRTQPGADARKIEVIAAVTPEELDGDIQGWTEQDISVAFGKAMGIILSE